MKKSFKPRGWEFLVLGAVGVVWAVASLKEIHRAEASGSYSSSPFRRAPASPSPSASPSVDASGNPIPAPSPSVSSRAG
jgi:hypothetical protein